MAEKYWMVTNRSVHATGFGDAESRLTYWVSEGAGDLTNRSGWESRSPSQFRKELQAVADGFPLVTDPAEHERQRHVTLFLHGYNNDWQDAVRRYQQICSTLYSGDAGLGLCVLFTWPSDGLKVGYYPDRVDARRSADELATVLTTLYEHLRLRQERSMATGVSECRAKLSIIAHSMGNYVVQKAMHHLWTRKNQPLLLCLINQLVMVAADVDNDLFRGGEAVGHEEGEGIANLTYRVTALYSGKDPILGVSAGLKHFGKRRLGRSGLDTRLDLPDNVWDIDCTQFFDSVPGDKVHSAYFEVADTRDLMRQVLVGVDRRVLADAFKLARAGG